MTSPAGNAFTERGGAAALSGLGRDNDLAATTVGVRGSTRLSADLPVYLIDSPSLFRRSGGLYQDETGTARGHHNPRFRKLAKRVCRIHGFDPESF